MISASDDVDDVLIVTVGNNKHVRVETKHAEYGKVKISKLFALLTKVVAVGKVETLRVFVNEGTPFPTDFAAILYSILSANKIYLDVVQRGDNEEISAR